MSTTSGSPLAVTRAQVLRSRVRTQQLDREPASASVATTDVLDLGVQDTGTGGAAWSLTNRGCAVPSTGDDELALAWTVRGAPHAYRRTDLPAVELALRPWSDRDAGKRIFNASKPLTAAGIGTLDALAAVATELRDLVDAPMVKGELSGRLAERMPEPYLRWCTPCSATRLHEMPFRLAALHAGLELAAGTSPPVLRRVPGWPADQVANLDAAAVPDRLHLVRAFVHHLGPATPAEVAAYLDAPLADVRQQWPDDVVAVQVDGQAANSWVLAADADVLRGAAEDQPSVVRLLGPFDLFLQCRDRERVVPDAAHRKDLWRTLGRPGAVLADGEVVGTWRPRATGRRLRLELSPWQEWSTGVRAAVEREAQRLAEHRGLELVP
ncbi:winged helix DNA-binding domain-containing protein [Rhodococcus sp. X156]|uniref:winged helix DNA-binding domain-containing protein n=1 Tax=Rhodococcus sp. X156 TaxID=2499145 RepID=UPI000FD9F78A|nr:winged helix DNA-binding domain-containing protein [Rhodococcus sp. X156]